MAALPPRSVTVIVLVDRGHFDSFTRDERVGVFFHLHDYYKRDGVFVFFVFNIPRKIFSCNILIAGDSDQMLYIFLRRCYESRSPKELNCM